MKLIADLSEPNNFSGRRFLVIVGPTAIGKSAVAIKLAKRYNGEVIGLDSRQIYRGMQIGTAQPSINEMDGITHHLIGIRSPFEIISAGEYARLVNKTILNVIKNRKFPIICGGSGLYFRALTRGFFNESFSDPKVREILKKRLKREGAKILLDELNSIDPEYSKIVHLNNHKRMLRALEIFQITGRSPTEHFQEQKKNEYRKSFYSIYLKTELDGLVPKINHRIIKMLENGWLEEVKYLMGLGLNYKNHPMQSLGYKYLIQYLNGDLELKNAIERIKTETRQFARKQMKWFDKEEIDITINISKFSKEEFFLRISKIINDF
ncbi:MAG: tRNA (adenosine(37)-N6)-dimethylallyltransferase MiaA [Candidatus Marinimicrobia bacterium]|nr:tRNA (adenosine(37)-N6)-dimethylallyltransferase MiaA [Candidatus Neomarinimicrobiota bacterium]|tara:strand:+ start:2025 stop:2990 length:966 start_codon:yes stop_codon:yes gene_type:complete